MAVHRALYIHIWPYIIFYIRLIQGCIRPYTGPDIGPYMEPCIWPCIKPYIGPCIRPYTGPEGRAEGGPSNNNVCCGFSPDSIRIQ